MEGDVSSASGWNKEEGGEDGTEEGVWRWGEGGKWGLIGIDVADVEDDDPATILHDPHLRFQFEASTKRKWLAECVRGGERACRVHI